MSRYQHEYSDSLVDMAVVKGKITPDDAVLIREYLMSQDNTGGLLSTKYNIFSNLVLFRQFIGEYRRNTFDDLFEGVTKISESGRKPTTIFQYLIILRKFYLWLIDSGYSSIPRGKVQYKIKVKKRENLVVTSDSILTSNDINILIQACRNKRDRALIALLYDAGLRPKDACILTWDQVTFNEYGVSLVVGEYPEYKRTIQCIMAKDFLVDWRNEYPEATGNNFVFITRKGNPYTHQLIIRLLGKIVKESGIKKPVHPHLIRRSRNPHLGTDVNPAG